MSDIGLDLPLMPPNTLWLKNQLWELRKVADLQDDPTSIQASAEYITNFPGNLLPAPGFPNIPHINPNPTRGRKRTREGINTFLIHFLF